MQEISKMLSNFSTITQLVLCLFPTQFILFIISELSVYSVNYYLCLLSVSDNLIFHMQL